DAIAERLDDLGYAAPGDRTNGLWQGTDDILGRAGPSLSVLLRNLVLTDGWVLASDEPAFLDTVTEVLRGDDDSLADTTGADRLLDALGEESPTNAVLWPTDFVCEDLAMAQAGTPTSRWSTSSSTTPAGWRRWPGWPSPATPPATSSSHWATRTT